MTIGDLPIVKPEGLIPLKARAWQDLRDRSQRNEPIDQDNIRKHRNDIFRLTLALTDEPFRLCDTIRADMQSFVNAFPPTAPEWASVLPALKHADTVDVGPAEILKTLVRHFNLEMPKKLERGAS
ncbi:MAG: hypothetical protein HY343_07780 [Lentisphaerae bacterium]|nr:hypothetical protein [Lentisphaerota bacterium]